MKYIEYAKFLNASDEVINWIEKNLHNYLEKNKENQTEIEHIIDYIVSAKAPKRLKKMSYEEAKNNTEKWTKSLQKKGKNIIENDDGVDIVLDFKDGFKFVKLKSKKSYEREGNLMHHCVASYYGRDVEIYSLRDKKNIPHCTIEKDTQIKGKGNGSINPKYIKYVVEFLEFTGMKVRQNEMKNLGYYIPKFKNYLENKELLFRGKYLYEDIKPIYSDDVIILETLKEVINYKGKKKCLLNSSADFERCGENLSLPLLAEIGGYANFERCGENLSLPLFKNK